MKKIILCITLVFTILCCSTSKTATNNNVQVDTKPQANRINSYKKYEIVPCLSVSGNDSTYINELRFYGVHSSFYTKKIMFDKFGKWDKVIRLDNERHPILIWENKKLFDDEVYSIATRGVENINEIYAAVIVLDSSNQDCFDKDYIKKVALINFFSKGIYNLSDDKKFYKEYWKIIH